MKKGKRLLAACMSALMLTDVLRLLPMSEFFKESTLTASAEYAQKMIFLQLPIHRRFFAVLWIAQSVPVILDLVYDKVQDTSQII